MAAYTTETITPKYHQALVAWQKKNFPEFEFLEKNWSKYYPTQTPYQLFAKIGKLSSDAILHGRMAGQPRFEKAGDMVGNMFYTARDIIRGHVEHDGVTYPDPHFTPALAKLIEDDAAAAAKAGDIPNLEGDPFIDGQDWQINSFTIAVKDTGPDKALGTVKFKNMKENMSVDLDLVKLKEGWRIDEIRTKIGSLRDLFKQK